MSEWTVSSLHGTLLLWFCSLESVDYAAFLLQMGNLLTCGILVAEHTQDKHVQRDDEFYDGDNDNDHDMEDASWIPIPWLPEPLVIY